MVCVVCRIGDFPTREQKRKIFGTLHEFACHPCAGAMLIFSVSKLLCIVPILVYVGPRPLQEDGALGSLL